MTAYRRGLICVLISMAISILWGVRIGRAGNAWNDFRGLYAASRCLIHHHNPYIVDDLTNEYRSEDGQRPPESPSVLQAIVLCVNMPTTLVVVAPLAVLTWGPAHTLWMLATGAAFLLAILLMWHEGFCYAPGVSTFLACILAINCETIFASGNAAGIVVGLCAVAVWCFLKNSFAWIGVLCLALSLAIKPHDSGIIWLYFLLAGGAYRKRALQSVLITVLIGIVAVLWVSHTAPTWMHDWKTNLAVIAQPGGINDPGPHSVTGRTFFSVIDLQAAISVFRDDAHFYNLASYIICGAMFLIWAFRTLRARTETRGAWFAIPAAAAFELLITYHRPWDAKLVVLAIPACCILWARRDRFGNLALIITTLAILFAGDVPLTAFSLLATTFHVSTANFGQQILTALFTRPEPLALLAMGAFYLFVYIKKAETPVETLSEVGQSA